ncbi:MAG: glycosyltransferase family 2 protein [Candidatus Aminicenantales bacterium]
MPELSVVIVNRNGGERLAECLASVEKERAGGDWEVLVVDNASDDGSPDLAAKRFPAVKLVRNRENLGFAKANNRGLGLSRGEFVLFLNPDTALFPGALDRLRDALRQDIDLGAVGPALLGGQNAFQVSFGGKVSFFRELIQKSVLNAWWRRRLPRLRRKRPAAWVSAACLMARRRALEKVGGFDEKFFLYFEDIDLCYRIREQGFRVVFLPEARVFHASGASTVEAPYFSRLEYRKSQLYFYEKHNSRLSQGLLRIYLRLSARLGGVFGSKGEEARAFRRDLLGLLRAMRPGKR